MSDEPDKEATIDALFAVASPAFNAEVSPYFTDAEAERLKTEAQTLWSNGHWLRMLLQDHGGQFHSSAPDVAAPTKGQLDEALAAVIISAFRIGAASVVHPANKRHLKSVEMEGLRKVKARSPKHVKRERIKNTILPPLLARHAPRHEQLAELNKALVAEGLDQISPETSDRWNRQVLKAMALASKNL